MRLRFLISALILSILIITAGVLPCSEAEPAQAQGPHLILFFDGATIPAGWTCISDDAGEPFNNRFPRGADIYGGQGGNATHTHQATDLVIKPVPYYMIPSCKIAVGWDCADIGHTHNIAQSSMSYESNYPIYRSLKVIRCNAGIPASVPAGAIAMFAHNPPAGWQRYSAQDNYYVLGNPTVATGGRDSHIHTNLYIRTGDASGTDSVTPDIIPAVGTGHEHEINASEIGVGAAFPPYKTVIMGKADADTAVPVGMLGLFDGTPPASWNVLSGTGSGFYHRFIQGNTTYGMVGGYETHSHPGIDWTQLNQTGWGAGSIRLATVRVWPFKTKIVSLLLHKHFYGCQFSEVSNVHPYTDVIVGAYEPAPPVVSTDDATAVLETGATLNGRVLDIGDTTVTERGFDWDTDGSTPFANSWTENGIFGTGAFSHGIGSLERGILYHLRGKAVNEALPGEWGYGAVIRFLTKPAVPTGFGAVAGDSQVSLSWQKGDGAIRTLIRRSTVAFPVNPTDGDPVYLGTDNTTTDAGLVNGTPYYYSAWSEVTRDTFQQFSSTRATVQSTPDNAPDVVTDDVTSLTGTSAILNASITNIYGQPVVERGFDWDINSGEPYANSWTETGSFGVSSYSHPLAGLPKGQVYYYRGKAKHAAAVWGYGQEMQFITKPDPPTGFTATAAGNHINLIWVNGAGSFATYICRSSTAYPISPDDGTFIYFGTGTALSDNLSVSTCVRYYYSAWSVAAGGDVAEFSDGKADAACVIYAGPGVTTNDATVMPASVAVLRGTLASLCLEPVVRVSFEWGSSPGVYTNTTPQQSMTNIGDFNQTLIGLSPGMACYYRAKVENHVTGYGLEKTFTMPQANGNYTGSSGTSSAGSPALPVPLPVVSVQAASLSAGKVAPGSTVTVNAMLANKGTVNGSMMVKLYVNGREEASRAVTVDSGKTMLLDFTVNKNEPGTYSVYVGGVNAGSFVVDEFANPDIILFFSAALVFFSFVLGMIYLWRRRPAHSREIV